MGVTAQMEELERLEKEIYGNWKQEEEKGEEEG